MYFCKIFRTTKRLKRWSQAEVEKQTQNLPLDCCEFKEQFPRAKGSWRRKSQHGPPRVEVWVPRNRRPCKAVGTAPEAMVNLFCSQRHWYRGVFLSISIRKIPPVRFRPLLCQESICLLSKASIDVVLLLVGIFMVLLDFRTVATAQPSLLGFSTSRQCDSQTSNAWDGGLVPGECWHPVQVLCKVTHPQQHFYMLFCFWETQKDKSVLC
jgi:hypothetical protein